MSEQSVGAGNRPLAYTRNNNENVAIYLPQMGRDTGVTLQAWTKTRRGRGRDTGVTFDGLVPMDLCARNLPLAGPVLQKRWHQTCSKALATDEP